MNNRGQNQRRPAGRGRGVNAPAPNRGGTAAGYQRPGAMPAGPPLPRAMGLGQGVGGGDVRAPTPNVGGRATAHREPMPVVAPALAAEGAIAAEDGRGSLRGRRVITEVVRTRPSNCVTKCGSSGKKINVETNYFRVVRKMNWTLYQYRVDFSPEVDLIRARRFYLAQHKELFGGYIFDGTVMFTAQHLQNEQMELFSRNREEETIMIKIKKVGVVESTDMQHVQALNLILRHAMGGLGLQLVGRNFFDPKAKITMGQYHLELWPGYTTSIRQHEQDILLCCEIAHKVMRTDTLYQILTKCLQESDNYQDSFKRRVVGTIVLTDYNNKTYRVDDVDFKATPKSKFSTKNGEISYGEYYSKRYTLKIRDLEQPLLVSRPTEKNLRGGQSEFIMLVPELCRATGITDDMRSDMRLMKAMGEHTRLMPERRIERLKTYNKRLQDSQASMEVLNSWNMQLDRNLVEVPGRVLPNEKIFFGNNSRYLCDNRADWTREFRNNSMFTHENITRWCVICPSRNVREVQNFVQMCIKAARGMGMVISNPRYEELRDDRSNSYAAAAQNVKNFDVQIVMVVLPRKNEEKYSAVKKKFCVDYPLPSQVCVLTTIAPHGDRAAGLMSVATKVVIQMNAKLGGLPWLLDLPLSGLMTVGFDVCHSPKGNNKSYGALVATMDIKKSGRYFSTVMEHQKYQELSNEISMAITYALKTYQETHQALPERIVFYRDGVGDGQLHQVFNTEINAIKGKLDEIYKSAGIATGCKFAFIVVSKRINTRYFVNRQNPVPGTVVDDIITLPERYDFFLVSQSVRQGTVSPTSYNVIYDTLGLTADRIQMLTYKMTHLYYNWSGTCRVPAVCQYAHKLAFLVAESLHRCPSNVLDKQLYFL